MKKIFGYLIQEIDFGVLEGDQVRDADGNYIDPQIETFFRDPVNFKRPEKGEDIFDVIARTKDFWDEKTSDPTLSDKTILVASHGCAVRALLHGCETYGKSPVGHLRRKSPGGYAYIFPEI